MLKAVCLLLLLEGSAMDQAREITAAEVKFSRIAENKAHNARVRDFAKMLVRDHDHVSPSNPSRIIPLNRQYEKKVDQLSKLSGEQFDGAFIDMIVEEHRQAARLFERLVQENGLETAEHVLPALKQHLDQAESLQRSLRRGRQGGLPAGRCRGRR
jgi:putative membrane protein